MAVKKKYRPLPDIDTGPFADVAFLLIIFFILATSLIMPMGRQFESPAARKQEKKEEQTQAPTITILADSIEYGRDDESQRTVTLDELRVELTVLDLPSKAEKERMIVVEMTDDVQYDSFFHVVAAISKAGGVVTLIDEGEEEGS